MAHPDLQVGGGGGLGGGGGHPDPELRRGPGLKKKTFSALWASVWSKNRGWGGRGGGVPGSATAFRWCATHAI